MTFIYRILITGSRDWDDVKTIRERLEWPIDKLHVTAGEAVVVTGACPTGADKIAEEEAKRLGYMVERHPANWKLHGKAAGPIRNKEMVDLGANICFAFIRNNSKGASGTATMAEAKGIPTARHCYEEKN